MYLNVREREGRLVKSRGRSAKSRRCEDEGEGAAGPGPSGRSEMRVGQVGDSGARAPLPLPASRLPPSPTTPRIASTSLLASAVLPLPAGRSRPAGCPGRSFGPLDAYPRGILHRGTPTSLLERTWVGVGGRLARRETGWLVVESKYSAVVL